MKSTDYIQKLFGLSGKTAVVIGGTGELCGGMALGLAQAGAEVVLVGRNAAKAVDKIAPITKAGGKAYYVQGDVTSAESMENLLAEVLKKSGRVDILINGAGTNAATPFLEISEEEFNQIIDTNLIAIFRACKVFGKYFIDEGIPASIINIGSMTGLAPLSRVFTYSATKAAVHNLSRNLAREWAEHGIRVNTLVPGFFPAEQNRKILDESRVLEILRHTPMSRFGNPDDLVGATIMLAADNASNFMTGTEVIVDGGFNAMRI